MRIELPSGTTAELVSPQGRAATRGVVLLPDIMGLRPLFDELAEQLARDHGWAVVEPEPFPGREALSLDERLAAMATFDHERHVADAVAAADVLAVEPVAVIGFCMGGMGALRAAATGRFDKAAAFYGMIRLPKPWAGRATHALDELRAHPGRAARVLAIVGTADPYTPAADVADLEAIGSTVVAYQGAEHGFVHDASRPSHRAADAADAWSRVVDWFSEP